MRKKLAFTAVLVLLMFVLSGCSDLNTPINAQSTGIWNVWFVRPLSEFITYVANLFGGSYGISIIICTLLVRLLILPLMIKQTRNSRAMQDIQPEMKKLKAKHSSKDQETQKKLQQETMKLFQEHKVNPLAGCFPLIVQMPILIAFYHAIYRTEAISQGHFLWFNLGSPDFILPFIAGITTFISQKLMIGSSGTANAQMKIMTYIMPIMICIFAFNFPAALALYWVTGNIFMIFQTYFVVAPMKKNKPETETGGAKK